MSQLISPSNPCNRPKPMDEEGDPIIPLISDVGTARLIHNQLYDDDSPRRMARAEVQGMIDGLPPLDEREMEDMGMGACSNIDWGDGWDAIKRKIAPYLEAMRSVPYFLSIALNLPSPNQNRYTWQNILSEEWSRMLKSWRGFWFRYIYLILYKSAHGVAYCHWNDKWDIRFDVSTAGETLVPGSTKADEDEFDISSTIVKFKVSELYDYIKRMDKGQEWQDEEAKQGWNGPMVRRAILNAVEDNPYVNDDWEAMQRVWKNNDLWISKSSKVCECVVMRIKEIDGKVTQYIFSANPLPPMKKNGRKISVEDQFLFREVAYFDSMSQAIIAFLSDIGTNGDLHSVRGTGRVIFPMVQNSNLLKNKFYDALSFDLSIPVTATDEALNAGLAYTQYGPFQIIPQGVSLAEKRSPDFSSGAIPGLEMIRRDQMEKQGLEIQAGGDNVNIFSQLQQLGTIDLMESTIYELSWEQLLREMLRRTAYIANTSSSLPSGNMVWNFKKRCIKRGVPEIVFKYIDLDSSCAVKPIGNGSAQARQATQQAILDLSSNFDEEGRNNAMRDMIASLPGVDMSHVDRYVPPTPDLRPGIETSQALNENQFLLNGMEAFVLPDQNHMLHLQNHVVPLEQINSAALEGQIPLSDAAQRMYPLYQHCVQHMQMMGENELNSAELADLRKGLHNLGEVINNGFKEAAAAQQREQELAQEGRNPDGSPMAQQPQQGDVSPSQMRQLMQSQTWLYEFRHEERRREEKHQLEMEVIRQKAAQQRKLDDVKNSAAMLQRAIPRRPANRR